MRITIPTLLAATAALAAFAACDSDGDGVDLRVSIQRAAVERCSALQSFSLRISVENRGDDAVTLSDITLEGEDSLVTGMTTFEADGATVAAGETVVYACTGGVTFSWPEGDSAALYTIDASVREQGGFSVSDEGPLRFFELFDNCNTAFPEPHACRPSL